MTSQNCFETLILLARPAAGKSEIIDFLKSTPLTERITRYHVGEIAEFDDFPMLWTWFEEDDILKSLGFPRLHSDEKGYFLHLYLWDVLIRRLNLEYIKWRRDIHQNPSPQTALIEFSRGSEHGGYARAFQHLAQEVASKASILYLDVSWEESQRKNRKRFNPDRPDSILEHGLPDHKLEKLYKVNDWAEVSQDDPEFISIQDISVPYVVFDNHDDITSQKGTKLGDRLSDTLSRLWDISQRSK